MVNSNNHPVTAPSHCAHCLNPSDHILLTPCSTLRLPPFPLIRLPDLLSIFSPNPTTYILHPSLFPNLYHVAWLLILWQVSLTRAHLCLPSAHSPFTPSAVHRSTMSSLSVKWRGRGDYRCQTIKEQQTPHTAGHTPIDRYEQQHSRKLRWMFVHEGRYASQLSDKHIQIYSQWRCTISNLDLKTTPEAIFLPPILSP